MYVRGKRIKGQIYYYLVKSERHGKKVVQKFIRYLGKVKGGRQPVSGFHSQAAEAMPEALQPLASEARKYKSAEEFVRSVPKTKQFGFRGAREIRTMLPLANFEQRILSTPEYRDSRVVATAGRQVKNPRC